MYPWLKQLIYSPGLHSKHFWFDFVPCCYYDIIVKFDFNFRITEILCRCLSRFYRMGFPDSKPIRTAILGGTVRRTIHARVAPPGQL